MKKQKSHLIGVEDLQKILKLVVVSGFLKNHKPLSLLISSEVGNGKTEITSSFNAKNTTFLTDLSSSGVYNILKNKEITHLIIADFTKITMKSKTTKNNLLTTLNSAMEEGLHRQELKEESNQLKGRNVGLITSTTRVSFAQTKNYMRNFGFDSRMIIVSFDYGEKTFNEVMESIYKSEYLKYEYKGIPMKNEHNKPITKKEVNIPYNMAKMLNKEGSNRFRTQKQLQTLACCNALLNERKEVNQDDVIEIIRLTKYMNDKYTKI